MTPASFINTKSAEAITSTAKGTYMNFFTTPIGGTSAAERLRINSTGDLLLGTTANPTANSGKVMVFGENGATNPTMGTNTAGLFAKDVSGPTNLFATYTDAYTTYYNRLETIAALPTLTIAFTAPSQSFPFLPGPYDSIIVHAQSYDATWVIGRSNGFGFNLVNELGDAGSTDYQRNSNRLNLPVNKNVVDQVAIGQGYTDPFGFGTYGSITYVNLPSTWSAVPDPNTYTFRDDTRMRLSIVRIDFHRLNAS